MTKHRIDNNGFALVEVALLLVFVSALLSAIVVFSGSSTNVLSVSKFFDTKRTMHGIRAQIMESGFDVDGDSYYEALKEGAGNSLPAFVTGKTTDEWNTLFQYCTWDLGVANGINANYTNNNVAPPAIGTVARIISAGKDKTFQTSCADTVAQKDDIIVDVVHADIKSHKASKAQSGVTSTASVDSSVRLLLHFEGDHLSTKFLDHSAYNVNISTSGSPQISGTRQKFDSGSGFFNGTSALQLPNHAEFDLAFNDFTIETWAYFTALPAESAWMMFYSHFDHSHHGLYFGVYRSGGQYMLAMSARVQSTFGGYRSSASGSWYRMTSLVSPGQTHMPLYNFGGAAGSMGLAGDWVGDGKTRIAVYTPSNGSWMLDMDGDGQWLGEPTDKYIAPNVFTMANDTPVVGDWNGSGTKKIGFFRNGLWRLDTNGNFALDAGDASCNFGSPGQYPVVGDWKGSTPVGRAKVGVFDPVSAIWALDMNGNCVWDGAVIDKQVPGYGVAYDWPIAGDWDGDGRDEIGIWRPSSTEWALDRSGNFAWDVPPTDFVTTYGLASWTDVPVVAKWRGEAPSVVSTPLALLAGRWYHFAVSKKGSNLYLFFNGSLVGTATNKAGGYPVFVNGPTVGAWGTTGLSGMQGNLDEFRLTIGAGRYTSNFALQQWAFGLADATFYCAGVVYKNEGVCSAVCAPAACTRQ